MAEMHSPSPLRLLLVDDHAVMRAGLANMLSGCQGFEVVAQADDGESALILHQEHSPDVILLDIVMPGMGGLECLNRLKQQNCSAKVLMLSSSELDQDIHQAIDLGAEGFISKTAAPSELISAISTVGQGGQWVSDDLSKRMKSYTAPADLTPREIEVLGLLRKGMTNPDIGMLLDITPRTAKAHVAAILLKLDAQDRAEAVARGFELGLLRP